MNDEVKVKRATIAWVVLIVVLLAINVYLIFTNHVYCRKFVDYSAIVIYLSSIPYALYIAPKLDKMGFFNDAGRGW